MWLGTLLAAEPPADDSLIVVVGGIVVAAIGALGLVLVEVIKGRSGRTLSPPPSAVDVVALAQDVAVLKDWRLTTREADNIHDHRVDRIEGDVEDLVRWHDREHPDWRP